MKLLKLTLASLVAATALYAKPINWGTGGPTGNYFSMSQEIIEICGEGREDILINTGGSSDNIFGATQKKYKIFWSSADVLFDAARLNPKVNQNNFKILARLHNEQVHLLIPKGWKPVVESSWADRLSAIASKFTSDGPTPVKVDINLLKNQVIGSWDGSIKAAEALSNVFQLNATVKSIPEAYRTNPGIPTILVGGAPYKVVEEILATGKYVLVSLDSLAIARIAPHYVPANVMYKVNGKVESIPTVAVPALLLGKASRKVARNKPMEDLATCIDQNLDILAEDSSNPNWETAFEANENGMSLNWSYFDIAK
jgi:hypothetical protein